MLTADLVTARRRGDELRLAPTDDVRRERVATLAAALTARAREEIGSLRDDVEEALRQTATALEEGGDRRLAAAVGKLVRDGLRFEETAGETATELRRELFTQAAAARRGAGLAPFDRAAFLDGFARARATTPPALEAALYADRPGAQRLLAVEVPAPALLAAGFEISEAQAVLLRATKIVAEVEAGDAALYRRLFRTLKFLRLLPVITPSRKARRLPGRDGRAAQPVSKRRPLRPLAGAGAAGDRRLRPLEAGRRRSLGRGPPPPAVSTGGGDQRRCRDRRATRSPTSSRPSSAPSSARRPTGRSIARPRSSISPGRASASPISASCERADGARVHFELLGFWSREAVFRRIDLVRAGLPHKILFAASKSLRVGEALLDDTPSARALCLFARAQRPHDPRSPGTDRGGLDASGRLDRAEEAIAGSAEPDDGPELAERRAEPDLERADAALAGGVGGHVEAAAKRRHRVGEQLGERPLAQVADGRVEEAGAYVAPEPR